MASSPSSSEFIISPPSSSFNYGSSSVFTNKILISAIITLFCVIIFVLLLHLYVRWLWWRSPLLRHHGLQRPRMSFSMSASAATTAADASSGLSKHDIDLLPVFEFHSQKQKQQQEKRSCKSDGDGGVQEELEQQQQQQNECAVCLCDFQEGEALRLLPLCKHCFHTACIDMWFYSHSTCPLCRAKVVAMAEASSTRQCDQHERSAEEEEEEEQQRSREELEERWNAELVVESDLEGRNFTFWASEASSAEAMMNLSRRTSSSRRQQRFLNVISGTRSLPHIRIEIESRSGAQWSPVSASSTPPSMALSRSSTPTESGPSNAISPQPLRSPGIRMAIRRILSGSEREPDPENPIIWKAASPAAAAAAAAAAPPPTG